MSNRNVFFDPLICSKCSDRLGWIEFDIEVKSGAGKMTATIYCDKCAKEVN